MIKRILELYRRLCWSSEKYGRYLGVEIGSRCDIQKVTFGSEPYLISIGDHVQITNGVKIFTHGAAWVFRDKYRELDVFGKVKIKDNVYIGSNSLILPGVTIGNNCIIGAGSVVTRSVSPGTIVAGNPARVIGKTDDFLKQVKKMNVGSKGMLSSEKKRYLLSLPESKFISK